MCGFAPRRSGGMDTSFGTSSSYTCFHNAFLTYLVMITGGWAVERTLGRAQEMSGSASSEASSTPSEYSLRRRLDRARVEAGAAMESEARAGHAASEQSSWSANSSSEYLSATDSVAQAPSGSASEALDDEDLLYGWPDDANGKYQKLAYLGRGSFGDVFLARRFSPSLPPYIPPARPPAGASVRCDHRVEGRAAWQTGSCVRVQSERYELAGLHLHPMFALLSSLSV